MEHESGDLYVLIGRLYSDLYRLKDVFTQLQKQLVDKDRTIQELRKELAQHKTTIDISKLGISNESSQ